MLLTPHSLPNGKLLKNRVVLAPLTRARNEDMIPKQWNVDYYTQRASAGLLITEGTLISQQGTVRTSETA